MANRVTVPVTNFETLSPPWSLASLDQDLLALQGSLNDSSLGYIINGTDTGTANNYVVATPSFGMPSNYNQGMTVAFMPANTNVAGSSLLNVGSLGFQPIQYGSAAVPAGWINAGQVCVVVYIGSAFQLVPPASALTGVRFNSVGNPTMEVDQRRVGNLQTGIFGASSVIIDRWAVGTSGSATMRFSAQQTAGNVSVPGSNAFITQKFLRLTLTTAQASLAATDWAQILQAVEGPQLRELLGDVHSVSLLVRSSVANLTFGLTLQSPVATVYGLSHLCTLGTANTWTLIQIPAIPVWTGSATWNTAAGNVGYYLGFTLAAGSSQTVSANDSWLATTAVGAAGQANFAASPVNSTFDIAFVQHEPGPVCTPLIDKPFDQNLIECQHYYQKTYQYGTAVGTVTNSGMRTWIAPSITNGFGSGSFVRAMAKAPTVTLYNHNTGAANSVQDQGATNHASAAATYVGDTGFGAISFTTATAGTYGVYGHYTADTGW